MAKYVAGRVLRMVPVLLILSVVVFSLIYFLPGDPATLMVQDAMAMSKDALEAIREYYGLNDPLHVQYLRFLSRAIRGDFGRSIRTNRPVMFEIVSVFPSTVQLTLAAMIVAVALGGVLGTIAALNHGSLIDNLSMVVSLLGVSVPIFWLGLLLILVFGLKLRWVPITGEEGWRRLILPAIALGSSPAGIIARLTRASLLEILRQDYVVTARAKGLRERSVIIQHALRNALIPVVTVVGLQFGSLLGGAVITEAVFARRGLGTLAVEAVLVKNFPVIQGTVFVAAITYMLINLMIDVLCAWLDPRIRYVEES